MQKRLTVNSELFDDIAFFSPTFVVSSKRKVQDLHEYDLNVNMAHSVPRTSQT